MPAPLRIAIFTPSFLPKCSGAEIFHHNLATRLAGRGHEVSVVVPRRTSRELAPVTGALTYRILPYPANTWSWFKRSEAVAFFLNRRALSRLQRRHRFDVWHGVVTYPAGVCLVDWCDRRAKASRPVPCIVRSVGDDVLSAPGGRVGMRNDPRVERLVRRVLPRVPRMVALSETMRQEYKTLGVPEDNLAVIPNAVDLERFQAPLDREESRRRLGVGSDEFLFLAVGRNHPQKDYPTLLDAVARLATSRSAGVPPAPPCKLVIAGRDAPALQPEVDTRGLGGSVRLVEVGLPSYETAGASAFDLPPREMIDLYRSADAFVMSSLLEGFSSAILEAMAAALPVIVTDAPGCADFVAAEDTGWIVPTGDPEALAKNMRALAADAGARQDLAARSLKRATAFDWPAVVDRYLELYREAGAPK